jgi:glutathione S-transferase
VTPITSLATTDITCWHPTGAAPVLQDGDVLLAESGAIVEYILTKYGNGKLAISPSSPEYANYLYYLHFSNAYLQAGIMRLGLAKAAKMGPDHPSAKFAYRNFERGMKILDDRLKETKWLAGEEFTAADVMMVWCVTTCRLFAPFSLKGYSGILRWLKDVGERPGYRRAMEKGDPGMKPLLGEEQPERISAEKL